MPKTRAELAPVEQRTLHRDYETRSRASLKKCGALRYAADPSTKFLCMAYAVDDGPVQLWRPRRLQFRRNSSKLRRIRAGS